MITTTLSAICAANPCGSGIRRLLAHVGKTMADARGDEAPLPVLTVLESNGIDDALWVLDRVVGDKRVCRLLAADYAERVHHLFAAVRPSDDRPMSAIRTARDPNATPEQLAAAEAAARAAARAAAWDAARAAAWDAAWAAAWAAGAAAWDAARAAARAAAWDAAGAAARAAAWDAARAAAEAAAGAAQKARLIQYLTHGEAAASMPWPDAIPA